MTIKALLLLPSRESRVISLVLCQRSERAMRSENREEGLSYSRRQVKEYRGHNAHVLERTRATLIQPNSSHPFFRLSFSLYSSTLLLKEKKMKRILFTPRIQSHRTMHSIPILYTATVVNYRQQAARGWCMVVLVVNMDTFFFYCDAVMLVRYLFASFLYHYLWRRRWRRSGKENEAQWNIKIK
jgi:hypothetical protein